MVLRFWALAPRPSTRHSSATASLPYETLILQGKQQTKKTTTLLLIPSHSKTSPMRGQGPHENHRSHYVSGAEPRYNPSQGGYQRCKRKDRSKPTRCIDPAADGANAAKTATRPALPTNRSIDRSTQLRHLVHHNFSTATGVQASKPESSSLIGETTKGQQRQSADTAAPQQGQRKQQQQQQQQQNQ